MARPLERDGQRGSLQPLMTIIKKLSDAKRVGTMSLTCTSVIRIKLVFLKDKLVVNILNIWQIEVRFCNEQRGLGGVHLGA